MILVKNIIVRADRPSKYVVHFSVDGRRHKKSFTSLPEAKDYARQYRRKKAETGLDSMFFLPEERADYKRTLVLAKKNGFATTQEFVESLLKRLQEQGTQPEMPIQEKTMQEAFNEYIALKVQLGRSNRTIKGSRITIAAFCKMFGSIPLSKLTQAEIEAFTLYGDVSPRTRKNRLGEVVTFLSFCRRKGYTTFQPSTDRRMMLPRELKKEKPVFSLGEVKNLLETLQSSERLQKFIPFYALQLFCGIRRAEAEKMRWQFINIEKQEVRLPAEITKTGEEHILRAPFLPPTVFAWLAPFVPEEDAPIEFPRHTLRKEIAELLGGWKQNGCRHTFATMHVSLHGNPANTAFLLRHRNQQKLWTNYLGRIVPEAEAREYFALTPKICNESQTS